MLFGGLGTTVDLGASRADLVVEFSQVTRAAPKVFTSRLTKMSSLRMRTRGGPLSMGMGEGR